MTFWGQTRHFVGYLFIFVRLAVKIELKMCFSCSISLRFLSTFCFKNQFLDPSRRQPLCGHFSVFDYFFLFSLLFDILEFQRNNLLISTFNFFNVLLHGPSGSQTQGKDPKQAPRTQFCSSHGPGILCKHQESNDFKCDLGILCKHKAPYDFGKYGQGILVKNQAPKGFSTSTKNTILF